MSISTMSQFQHQYSTIPQYHDSQYVRTIPPMKSAPSQELRSVSPHGPVPPSPSSSTSDFKVSKAKKGKRVHACEFPGCVKVFTRAEHRRRHELSHRSKKTYTCSYEGCTKAFHRADYLVQHMARHESGPAEQLPLRSNSTSSAVSQVYYAKSPVFTGYQSPVPSVNPGTPSAPEQSMRMCSNLNCPNQNRLHGSPNQGCQLYNYPQGSNLGPFIPQSSPPAPSGLDAIDQYLRSVLRPEAFLPAMQSQGQINSSFWNSNVDPNLPQMNSVSFQQPITYPWASGESLPPHIQPSHRQESQERNT